MEEIMECKYCGKELPEDMEVCPQCARFHEAGGEEDKAPEKLSIWKVVAATAICVVLLFVLVGAVIYGITGKLPYNLGAKEPAATQTTAPAAQKPGDPADLNILDGILDRGDYCADKELDQEVLSQVVATAGDAKLTNGQLQVLFWQRFADFISGYDYASLGLDPSKPLGSQKVMGYDVTWEQYFLSEALNLWHTYSALNLVAEEAGYALPEDVQQQLLALPVEYDEEARKAGYESGEAMLRSQMGPGVTMEDLVAVEWMYALGDHYYSYLYDGLNFSREEVEAYFDTNAALFASNYNVTKETGLLVDVRHVLLQPEGCTFDENSYVVATDGQWEACRKEAQAMLDGWVKGGATEESFSELAVEHSACGSAPDGGLLSYQAKGQNVAAFDSWCFDENRKAGDYGLVKTEFGYHLVYYVGGEDAWYLFALPNLSNDTVSQTVKSAGEAAPLQTDLSKISIGTAELTEPTAPAEGN